MNFLLFSLSVSPFGPHVSKSVRARMNVRTNTYPFCGFAAPPIGSVVLTAFVHVQATDFSKPTPIVDVIRRSGKKKKMRNRRLAECIWRFQRFDSRDH